MAAGAVASAVNAVAGGGTLITFPILTGPLGLPSNVANATNALGLWPGSLGGACGFWNLLHKTKHHFRALLIPTILGALAGSELFVQTPKRVFDFLVPVLILLASLLLLGQKSLRLWVLGPHRTLHPYAGIAAQFAVAVYGGYFGAGMGIMMLAAFALYMEGNIHEINAIKAWLGVFINLIASGVFLLHSFVGPAPEKLIEPWIGLSLAVGSIVGGFYAAKLSQKVNPDRLRIAIAIYGLTAAAYYAAKAIALV
ncbi:MAG: sulfite exporter TauE/SafE family protein [Fimbriimonas sp.]